MNILGPWILFGQIIATSHDIISKNSWEREIPEFQQNLGWWNIIYSLARSYGRVHQYTLLN